MSEAFDNKKYLKAQQDAFESALSRDEQKPVFMEFGGKPFGDNHAERVLPGYERDSKAEILRETTKLAEVVMVVNALDILQQPDGRTLRGRIRGDTGLMYDQETVRLLGEAHDRDIPIKKVVMAVTPRDLSLENQRHIDTFSAQLKRMGTDLLIHSKVEGYPDTSKVDIHLLKENDAAWSGKGNLVAISPGGGSGKFGMLLSEMYTVLAAGGTPDYVKFETFPIFRLDAEHALNLAFEAATADLKNRAVNLEAREGEVRTTYDKDVENFALLKKLFETFGKKDDLLHIADPVDMGVNRIVDGIVDMEKVVAACHSEIIQRIQRYKREVGEGIERVSTLQTAEEILGRFEQIYGIATAGE
jgi:uncharacterized protein (UPF0371 family)